MTEVISSEERAGFLSFLHRLSITPASVARPQTETNQSELKKKHAIDAECGKRAKAKYNSRSRFGFDADWLKETSRLLSLVTSDLSDQIFNWLEKAETK